MTNNMRFAVLTIFVYLLYSCSLNDDFNKDDVVNALYNKHDRRLLDYDAVIEISSLYGTKSLMIMTRNGQ